MNSSSIGLITLEADQGMSEDCEMAGLWHGQSIPFYLLRIDVSCSQINLAVAIGIDSEVGQNKWICNVTA